MKLKAFLIPLILLINALPAFPQQYNFLNFTVEDGLPQSTVFDIYQDNNRYLWIGTDGGGLCRYDGYRYKTYGEQEGLKANVVRKIIHDKEDKLWIATNEGLFVMDNGKINAFDTIINNSSIYFFSVFVDSKNTIWAASSGNGIYKISPSGANGYTVENYTTSNGLSSNYTLDICEDGQGLIWIATYGNGLDIFNSTQENFTNISTENGIASDKILCIKKLDKNTIVAGTHGEGAFRINTDMFSGSVDGTNYAIVVGTERTTVWSIYPDTENGLWITTDNKGIIHSKDNAHTMHGTSNGLGNNQILKVFVDAENILWIGSNGSGIFKYIGNRFMHVTDKELPSLSQVTAIAKDDKGNYWLGTNETGLYYVSYLNNQLSLIKHFTKQNGLSDNKVTGLSIDKENNLWIATNNGFSKYNAGAFTTYYENKNVQEDKTGLISNKTNCIFNDSKGRVWIGTAGGLSMFDGQQIFLNMSELNGFVNNEIQCITEDSKNNIWIGTYGGLVMYDGEKLHTFVEEDGLTNKKINSLTGDKNGNIYIGTFGGGLYKYSSNSTSNTPIAPVATDQLSSKNIYSLVFQNDSVLLVGTDRGINRMVFSIDDKIQSNRQFGRSQGFKAVENSINAVFNDEGRVVWFGTLHGATIYFPQYDNINLLKPLVSITGIKVNGKNYLFTENLLLKSDQNSLKISFQSISLTNPTNNSYYCKLIGLDTTWNKVIIDKQEPDDFATIEYKKLQPGNYKLIIKSYNNNGIASDEAVLNFVIALPFYRTFTFIIAAILFSLAFFYFLVKLRERKLISEKIKLELIVEERTMEVVQQKEIIQEKNKDIMDSINYAQHIQTAILPSDDFIAKVLPESFILYKPKDVVSGDFYWLAERENRIYVAVVDCTGHGVPGAFMSMIGSSLLSTLVNDKGITDTGNILSELHVGVKESLKQEETHNRDGMDVALLRFDKKEENLCLQYSGANRPVWLIRNGSLEETKHTKASIGGLIPDGQQFQTNELNIEKGDLIYIFSDGYPDQFGGEKEKKFSSKRLKALLLSIHEQPILKQKKLVENAFNNWRGNIEQIDDVCLIGIKV